MTSHYDITRHDGFTEISFGATPDLSTLKSAFSEFVANDSSRMRLWDLTRGFDLSKEQVTELARFSRAQSQPSPSKVAILVADDLSFGLLKMFSVYGKDVRANRRVYRDREQAIAWLGEAI